MSTQSEVLHCYEQIAPLTERMLLLARSHQWAGLPALEAQFSAMVAHLAQVESAPERANGLDERQIARKLKLLARINANQAAICGLVMPQLARLPAALRRLSLQDGLPAEVGAGARRLH